MREKTQDIISTILVMLSTLISRLMGFLKIKVFSYYFGASLEADIFNHVFNIPNSLRKILSEGAMTSAFLPEFSFQKSKSESAALEFFRVVTTFNLIILPLIIFSLIFFSKELISLLSSFRGENLNLASSIFNYLIIYLLLISLSSLSMAVLNAKRFFIISSLSPILFSLSIVLSTIFLHKSLGIYSAVFGVLVGGILQFLVQFIACCFLGYFYLPNFNFKLDSFKRFLNKWKYMMSASLLTVISQQITFTIASNLEQGSVSVLSSAIVYYQMPVGIFYVSIATIIFPKMSHYAAKGEREKLDLTLNLALEILILFLIPISFMLYLWSYDILNLLLRGGRYLAYDTERTAKLLEIYSLALFFSCSLNFFERYNYSQRNSKTPFIITSFVITLDILLSLTLSSAFSVNALAIAHLISTFLGVLIYCSLSIFKGLKFNFKELSLSAFYALLTLPFLYLIFWYFKHYFTSKEGFSSYNFLLFSLLSVLIVLICYYIFKVRLFFNFVKRKV